LHPEASSRQLSACICPHPRALFALTFAPTWPPLSMSHGLYTAAIYGDTILIHLRLLRQRAIGLLVAICMLSPD
jgi:hypothetical protein